MDRTTVRRLIAEQSPIREQLLAVLAGRLRRTNDDLCDLIHADRSCLATRAATSGAGQRFGTCQGDRVRIAYNATHHELAVACTTNTAAVMRHATHSSIIV